MFWDPWFEDVAKAVGAPSSQIKTILTLLLSYPLAALFVRIPHTRPNFAHIYSLVIATFYLIPLLGLAGGTLHLLFSCFVTYGMVITLHGPKMPWTVFAFVMGHLLFNHIQRYISRIPVTTIEITFVQMVLAMKLITFAWNVHDGRQKAEDLDASQLATRLSHVPSPLAFLGYCFFFPAFLIGPSFDYSTYNSLVTGTIYTLPPPGIPTDLNQGKRTPYGRKRVAYLHLGIGLAFLGVYAVSGGRGGYDRILGDEWVGWGKVTRFGFVQFAGVMARTKYYAVWSLSEGACVLTGLGFNGYDPKTGRTLWNRVRNVNIIAIETAESFKVLFDSWNCRTNVWLRDCVYKRLVVKGKKPGTAQSMATFLTSAIWHGIEPGYYLAFVMAGVLTSLGRQFRHFVRPYFLPPSTATSNPPNSFPQYPYPNSRKRIYDVLGWAMVQINLNFIASAFMLLNLRDSLFAWGRMGWYTPILAFLATTFFRFGRRSLRKGLKGQASGKEEKKEKVPEVSVSPPSPPDDERDPKDLRWVKHALDNPGYQDAGQGVHPDAGFIDDLVKGMETPREGGRSKYD